MDHGYSTLLQQYVSAHEVDHGDCEAFQITCPACNDPVFKVLRTTGGKNIHYLAHYKANDSDHPDCEMRVAAISADQIMLRNRQARGQHLQAFLKVMQDAILEGHWPPDQRKEIAERARLMMQRPYFKKFIRATRDDLVKGNFKNSPFWNMDDQYDHLSPFWRKRQKAFALDMFDMVSAPNGLQNFAFLACVGLPIQLARMKDQIPEESPTYKALAPFLGAFYGTSDKDLQAATSWATRATVPDESGNPVNALSYALALIYQGMVCALVEIPYLDILRRILQDRATAPS